MNIDTNKTLKPLLKLFNGIVVSKIRKDNCLSKKINFLDSKRSREHIDFKIFSEK